jgi:hypothetical protein
MARSSYFWSHFEEPSLAFFQGANRGITPQAPTGEEPDPRMASFGKGTETLTKTREERDQDASHSDYGTLPPVVALNATGTRTLTETREESDQDVHNGGHCAVPRHPGSLQTQSMTKTSEREEPDQDFANTPYGSIPRIR